MHSKAHVYHFMIYFLREHLYMITQYTHGFLKKGMNMYTGNGSDVLTEPCAVIPE